VTLHLHFTGVVVPLTAVPATVSESSDEGIGSMSPEPVAIVTNTPVPNISALDSGDPSREMIELRVQLDRERRLRMHLEDQVPQFSSLSKLAQTVTRLTCV
jgi:transcription factor AP-4